jgi:hypothetical protein
VATISEIREAIGVRLKTIPNLRVPKRVPDTIDPDAAVVRYAGTTFDTTMSRGSDDQNYIVQVFTSKASDRGQDALLEYCDGSGERSIKAAMEGDPTLGGLVMHADVTEVREPGRVEVAKGEFYSVEIVVTVSVEP